VLAFFSGRGIVLGMEKLTEEQYAAMLQLGDTESTHELISAEVIDQLIAKNLVYKRDSKTIDFTDAGALLYESLIP
jgi:hypothetical protein